MIKKQKAEAIIPESYEYIYPEDHFEENEKEWDARFKWMEYLLSLVKKRKKKPVPKPH